jgi:hypothetical protein
MTGHIEDDRRGMSEHVTLRFARSDLSRQSAKRMLAKMDLWEFQDA